MAINIRSDVSVWGDLYVSGGIIGTGLIQGVSLEDLTGDFSSHTGDSSIHFTAASLDGVYAPYTEFINHTGDSSVHFTSGSLAGNFPSISNFNSHTGDDTIHFTTGSLASTFATVSYVDSADDTLSGNITTVSNNLAGYQLANDAVVGLIAAGVISHTGDSSIHFTTGSLGSLFADLSIFESHTGNDNIHFLKSEIELDDLNGVNKLTPSDGDILRYTSSSWDTYADSNYVSSADLTALEDSFTGHTGSANAHDHNSVYIEQGASLTPNNHLLEIENSNNDILMTVPTGGTGVSINTGLTISGDVRFDDGYIVNNITAEATKRWPIDSSLDAWMGAYPGYVGTYDIMARDASAGNWTTIVQRIVPIPEWYDSDGTHSFSIKVLWVGSTSENGKIWRAGVTHKTLSPPGSLGSTTWSTWSESLGNYTAGTFNETTLNITGSALTSTHLEIKVFRLGHEAADTYDGSMYVTNIEIFSGVKS
jgi:hypothetical protein